jgi:hypothetical protein
VTFDDAVAMVYMNVFALCKAKKQRLKVRKMVQKIRKAYGSRKAAMREELDAIPRDGSSVCLPTLWVERAMSEPRTILR